MAVMFPWYCVREEVKQALDFQGTARANSEVDRQIAAAARSIEGVLHRKFYPMIDTRSWDWPNIQVAWPWRLWLDHNELAGAPTDVLSGGVDIPIGNIKLYPDWGPPFRRIEIDVSTTSAFAATATWQKSITVSGPFGFRMDEIPAGTLAGNVDAVTTSFNPGVPGYRGVGSVLRVDSERMIITGRQSTTTSQTLGAAGLAASTAATAVQVPDITQFAIGETITIDAESMLIQNTAGTNLIVKRAWDGTVLAAHSSGATIYANRLLTVARAALGTTAATHAATTPIMEHDPPALIRQLNVAQAVVNLIQTRAGYPAPIGRKPPQGQSDNMPATQPSDLSELWDRATTAYARQARKRTV